MGILAADVTRSEPRWSLQVLSWQTFQVGLMSKCHDRHEQDASGPIRSGFRFFIAAEAESAERSGATLEPSHPST